MDWWVYLIIAIVAFAILAIIFTSINKKFIRKYGFSLYGGGILLLIAVGSIVGGYFCIDRGGFIPYILFAVGAIALLITLIYDFKKCGFGGGILALFLQILFCAPSILVVFDLLFNRGRSTLNSSYGYKRDYRAYREGRRDNDEY